jgi:hypothetical protein
MAATAAGLTEDSVRRQMRRQQFANTLLVALFALVIIACSVVLARRWHQWPYGAHPARSPGAAVRPASAAHVTALAPVVPATPSSVAVALPPARVAQVVKPPKPKSTTAPKPTPPATKPVERQLSPTAQAAPVSPPPAAAPTPAPASTYDIAGSSSAARVLVGIKCTDDLRYEGILHGRRVFSARCESGDRRSVSCLGGGCSIQYEPPPSHVP